MNPHAPAAGLGGLRSRGLLLCQSTAYPLGAGRETLSGHPFRSDLLLCPGCRTMARPDGKTTSRAACHRVDGGRFSPILCRDHRAWILRMAFFLLDRGPGGACVLLVCPAAPQTRFRHSVSAPDGDRDGGSCFPPVLPQPPSENPAPDARPVDVDTHWGPGDAQHPARSRGWLRLLAAGSRMEDWRALLRDFGSSVSRSRLVDPFRETPPSLGLGTDFLPGCRDIFRHSLGDRAGRGISVPGSPATMAGSVVAK